jgi:5-methylthioadenosine/S-adenosylhomocysteine deaminase
MALAIESTAHWIAAGMSTEELIEAGHRLATERSLKITNHTSGGTLALETGYLRAVRETGRTDVLHLMQLGVRAVRETGRTDVLHLMQLGVLDSHWLLIHGINLTDTDIKLMANAGCHAVYTPTSEAIRGGGIGPWLKLIRAGVNTALGTDGPMVDSTVDMVEQMKAACLIQNTGSLEPGALSIEQALQMATINAARALGMEDEIGSLEVGKRADIVLFDLSAPYIQPAHKPISNFVTCGRGADAHTVIINGRPVLHERRFTLGPDPKDVIADATARSRFLAGRAGVLDRARMQWPTSVAM